MTLCRAFGPVYNAKNFKGHESIEKGLGRYTIEEGISYFTIKQLPRKVIK